MSEVLLADLYTGETAATVKVGDMEIGFTYQPNVITVEKATALAEGRLDLVDMLDEVLVSWEIVMVPGEDFPPTAENIAKLPVPLMRKIMKIVRDATGEVDETGNDEDGEDTGSFGSS